MRPGDVIADQFELARLAGAGGMGEVWQAVDRLHRSTVAVKMLRGTTENGRKRFTREALLLADLRHPGIVRYLAHGVTPADELYLVMEWLEGEDLSKRLARVPLTVEDTLALLRGAADALSTAHARGIVHRDLKPANLFLPGGTAQAVKILDFGVARAGDPTRTRAPGMAGTPGYMAPEQARGEEGVDARADVFALGCVAFECLTGRRAFEAEHVMAVFAKILVDDVPRVSDFLPDAPPELDALVSAMLAKDPAQRPRDASELAVTLQGIDASSSTVKEPRPSALTRSEQRMIAVVLVPAAEPANDGADGAEWADVRRAAEERGAKVEHLADGSLLAVLSKKGVVSDLAAQAAECALAMRRALADRSMSLAVGRGQLGTLVAGEAIDRAAGLLLDEGEAPRTESRPSIVVDEVTAALLDARFEIRPVRGRLELAGALERSEAPRTLLGKATTCVGREREIAALEAIFEECAGEPVARAVLVTASAGAGKSRLRSEVVARIRASAADGERAAEIWIGRADPMRSGSAFRLVAQILRHACDISEGERLETRQQKLEARIARNVRESERRRVTEFLGELIGAPFSDDDSVQLQAARRDAMLLGDQMRLAFEDFMLAECERGPVVLVLEDLHWGDLPTVKLIDSVLRNLRQCPLMVLALARPEVHDLFPKLWAHREMEEVRLGALTKKASERLVREVLGAGVAVETVATIVERAEGNAFYLEELIRAVAEGRTALPETLVAMVEARLSRLDPEARRVLRAGSVFGQTFWKGSAIALLGGSAHAAEWLRELTEEEIVTRHPTSRFAGEEEYGFRHALMHDGAYAMLTDADKHLGHTLAGEWLEGMGERDAMLLAEHFERGGARERALRWYPRAAEQALEGNDLQGVLTRVERGVSCGAEGPVLGALRAVEAEAQNWRGTNAESLRLAREAMALLPKAEAPWFTAAREAVITAGKLGDGDKLVELVQMLEREEAPRDAAAIRNMALGWGAANLVLSGKYAHAEQVLAAIEAGPSDDGAADPRLLAVVDKAKAMWAFFRGNPQARQWLERSVAGFERSGDLRNAATTRADLAFVFLEFGGYQEAERLLRRSLAETERMSLHTSIPQVKHNLGFALMGLGRLDEAAQLEIDAAEALRQQGHPRIEGLAETYLARIRLLQGDHVAARAAAERAVELLQIAPASRAMAFAVLAQALLAAGEKRLAFDNARAAIDLLRSLGALEEGETLVRLTFAETLRALGDPAAASAIAEARAALLTRAEGIADPASRTTFLERVPENAATLALAGTALQ